MKISRKSKTLRVHCICHVQGEYDKRNVRQKVGKSSFLYACRSLVSIYIPTSSTIYLFVLYLQHTWFAYKRLTFADANVPKTLIEIRFKYLGNKQICGIFKMCCIISVFFPRSVVYFIILYFFLFK
jgi:hypothetical protein